MSSGMEYRQSFSMNLQMPEDQDDNVQDLHIEKGVKLLSEWLGGLCSLCQVTEVKLGQVRSNSGWVTLEA